MDKLRSVISSIEKCASKAGRNGQVELMAVSKTHPYEAVLEAYREGQRLFGENRVQEIEAKFPPLSERPEGMKLCLIGHLQKNKVKKAVGLVDRIDSVDSRELLFLIEKEAAKLDLTLPILFEVNSSGEEQKSGFRTKEELFEAVKALKDCPHVVLQGLMTVGPLGGDEEKNRAAFRYTKTLFDELNSKGYGLTVLSMGMSGDYETAIEEGSTEVRIGTAIFGERSYNV